MVEGKRRDEWDRTSHVLAFIANAQRTKKDKLMTAAECNPYLVEEARRNRPKHSDVKHLARIMGIDVPEEVPHGK